METYVTLPKWLDDYIFGELGAKYCRSNADMTVIDWDKSDVLNYLGTYFPRSYAEASCIMGDYLYGSKSTLLEKECLSFLDFGCGTGGEIVGLISQLKKYNEKLKSVSVYALDGNFHALRLCEAVLKKFSEQSSINVKVKPIPVVVQDLYDMSVIDNVLTTDFDMVISFKAICEFVTKERFEKDNAYGQVVKTLMPKLKQDGILLLVDVTSYNDVSNEWLPRMMDAGIHAVPCRLIHQNEGYSQPIHITHSHKLNDVSKVAWKMITPKN